MHWRLMASAKAKSQTYILANMTTYPSSQRKKRDHKKVLDLQKIKLKLAYNGQAFFLNWISILFYNNFCTNS